MNNTFPSYHDQGITAGLDANDGQRSRRYGQRACRICLDVEQPKFNTGTSSTLGLSGASSKPLYQSDDPDIGRLFSPCNCKGTQKYVHEGCLNAWRRSNPSSTSLWKCPTCKYSYRIERLQWAKTLSNWKSQAALTTIIFLIIIFLLGFIADPIFQILSDLDEFSEPLFKSTNSSWGHFVKGFISLAAVGVLRSMPPWYWSWYWFNLRGRGRRRGSGRGRLGTISLIRFVLIGALAVLPRIWQGVRAVSSRILTRISDTVLDVVEDDADEPDLLGQS